LHPGVTDLIARGQCHGEGREGIGSRNPQAQGQSGEEEDCVEADPQRARIVDGAQLWERAAVTEAEALRERAQRCCHFAQQYATDVGQSLVELAVELDRKAERLESQSGAIS
jgi:hypothetical protein